MTLSIPNLWFIIFLFIATIGFYKYRENNKIKTEAMSMNYSVVIFIVQIFLNIFLEFFSFKFVLTLVVNLS